MSGCRKNKQTNWVKFFHLINYFQKYQLQMLIYKFSFQCNAVAKLNHNTAIFHKSQVETVKHLPAFVQLKLFTGV